MARSGYLLITGAKTGAVKGGVKQSGHEDTIEVLAVEHEINVPTDVHSGQIFGRRQHKPFKISKALDKATPLLYQMMCNGENIKSAEIKFNKVGATGGEVLFFTYILEDVKIIEIKSIMHNVKDKTLDYLPNMEEVSLSYRKITWKIEDGGIQASDDWLDRQS